MTSYGKNLAAAQEATSQERSWSAEELTRRVLAAGRSRSPLDDLCLLGGPLGGIALIASPAPSSARQSPP